MIVYQVSSHEAWLDLQYHLESAGAVGAGAVGAGDHLFGADLFGDDLFSGSSFVL